jgi:hypothetical protein
MFNDSSEQFGHKYCGFNIISMQGVSAYSEFREIVDSLFELYVGLNSMTSLVKTKMFKSGIFWFIEFINLKV